MNECVEIRPHVFLSWQDPLNLLQNTIEKKGEEEELAFKNLALEY